MKARTIKEILDQCRTRSVESWVHEFLLTSGRNPELSEGLKKARRYWLGPQEFPVESLMRACGPEGDMEYVEDEAWWNGRVRELMEDMAKSLEPAPLILEFRSGKLSIRDGNHRFEAQVRGGAKKVWAVLWFNTEDEFRAFDQSGLRLPPDPGGG